MAWVDSWMSFSRWPPKSGVSQVEGQWRLRDADAQAVVRVRELTRW